MSVWEWLVSVSLFRGDGGLSFSQGEGCGGVGGAADIVEEAVAVDVEYTVLNELAESRLGFRAGKVG